MLTTEDVVNIRQLFEDLSDLLDKLDSKMTRLEVKINLLLEDVN